MHCYAHRLNLCVLKMTKIVKVKDMFEHCRCITEFFSNSPKRTEFYKEVLKEMNIPETKKKKLLNVCRTRYHIVIWIFPWDKFILFKISFLFI